MTKQSKTVLLPLADGRKLRIERKKIRSVTVQYSLFSKTSHTVAYTDNRAYDLMLSQDAAKRLIYGDDYEKSE